ncbi:alkaline phosphatase family protein [Aliifodinibius sp. S!AR15-10]|uniref:alkaline phosphatase family protein n=1 Tax=Aliifodinibius sp. S!AR15-10 TaxID=2950437 RepID=UPI002863BA86|nr:alkaline phosphatase family protein [Aliifodinibius sp. S!AR15-10]MDR8391315.1 alkaline phosphatase family protein [Aliifodinibius sp. S!AR15-10]
MAIIFLFIDGVGLGEEGRNNPFTRQQYAGFEAMCRGQSFSGRAENVAENYHLFKGIDATLGIEGLPQSGTGQATLFTGENAAKIVGRHFGPFPHSKTKPGLRNRSIFKRATELGKSCVFMNAYPDIFFDRSEKRNRWSCTTLMTKSAGIRLHTERDLKEGSAITAEITQEAWREQLGIEVPKIEPAEAGQRMLDAAVNNDLVLYEYYLTDKAGHARSHAKAEDVLHRFDLFLQYLIQNRRERDTILLSSDHGNVEDLSTKTHTFNQVPLFVKGPVAEAFEQVDSIQDITPTALKVL